MTNDTRGEIGLNKKFIKYLTAVCLKLSFMKESLPINIFTRHKIKETFASPWR
jgi:hypothetical protein